jgi:hypothetical protein
MISPFMPNSPAWHSSDDYTCLYFSRVFRKEVPTVYSKETGVFTEAAKTILLY